MHCRNDEGCRCPRRLGSRSTTSGDLMFLFPVESDALSALLLCDADLLQGVGRQGVWCGQQWGLGLVASLVSNEGDHGGGAIGECEAVGRNKRFECMWSKICSMRNIHLDPIMENVSSTVGAALLPVGSLHVALTLASHHAVPLLGNAVACLDAVAEGSVAVVGALVEDHRGVFVGAGGGGGEGQQAGEHGLAEGRGSVY